MARKADNKRNNETGYDARYDSDERTYGGVDHADIDDDSRHDAGADVDDSRRRDHGADDYYELDDRSHNLIGIDEGQRGWRARISPSMLIWLRYLLIAGIVLVVATLTMRKVYHNTVKYRDEWTTKANKELSRQDTILPIRGDILAADGSILATNLRFYTIRMDMQAADFREKDFVAALDSLCDSLAKYYPVRNADAWKRRFNRELGKDKNKRTRCLTIVRDVTDDQYQQFRTFPFFHRWTNPNKTGLTAEARMKRQYPYGDMARRSIGIVGQTKTSKEVHGRSGLEQALDSLLYGKIGRARKVPLTHRIQNWTDVPAQNGYTLLTTIDVGMQDIMEGEMTDILTRSEAKWGAAIMMEVATGDIKAICNLERDSAGNYIESMYHVLLGYEPGSVMKTISMVVALEDGFVTNINQEYSIVRGAYRFGGGSPINDTHSPPSLPVSRFLEYSSNQGMTKLVAPHFAKDPNGFRERLRRMGFLDRFKTGIAGETPPFFPHLSIESGGLTSLGRQTYGYASRISPLYMCAFYNAVANDGKFVRPRIVKALRNDHGVDSVLPVTYVRDSICSVKNARIVRKMLHGVIYGRGGTAQNLRNDIIELAGKTGTAKLPYEPTAEELKRSREAYKVARTHADSVAARPRVQPGYRNGHYRLAFCGFFPYENPKYTCMVLICDPTPAYNSAGRTAGGVVRNMAMKMYSRGMLGNRSDYRVKPDGSAVVAQGTAPVVYGGMDNSRVERLGKAIGSPQMRRMPTPKKTPGGTVPDVRGLSVRDALRTLESAGYKVTIRGSGYVRQQTPAPGVRVRPSTPVILILTS